MGRNNENDPTRIGWRTEFRPMEVQLTDFENAAFTVFIILITRVVLMFDLNLYIPLSKVDDNMKRAHKRDAVKEEKFYFRKHITTIDVEGPDGESSTAESGMMNTCSTCDAISSTNSEYEEMP